MVMKPLNLAEEQETPLIAKTKELCAVILGQPGYETMKQSILEFMHHEEARVLYENLCDFQDQLHSKHSEGLPITPEEDAEFREMEKRFLAMPVASAFISAQRQMQKIEKTVAKYVRRTFELGRVPEAEDMASGCGCGGGSCGC
jgi:cell fate (sporulation/competence/biofilm development) regulator YlbF (YheA/YmcA/DUF963 family)